MNGVASLLDDDGAFLVSLARSPSEQYRYF